MSITMVTPAGLIRKPTHTDAPEYRHAHCYCGEPEAAGAATAVTMEVE